jgi:hypothetical protein
MEGEKNDTEWIKIPHPFISALIGKLTSPLFPFLFIRLLAQ